MLKPIVMLAAAMLAMPALAQEAAPAAAAPTLPPCSAKVTDSCQQTPKQEARAMNGAQVDARDARNGGMWTPDGKAAKAKAAAAPPQ